MYAYKNRSCLHSKTDVCCSFLVELLSTFLTFSTPNLPRDIINVAFHFLFAKCFTRLKSILNKLYTKFPFPSISRDPFHFSVQNWSNFQFSLDLNYKTIWKRIPFFILLINFDEKNYWAINYSVYSLE